MVYVQASTIAFIVVIIAYCVVNVLSNPNQTKLGIADSGLTSCNIGHGVAIVYMLVYDIYLLRSTYSAAIICFGVRLYTLLFKVF